MHKPDAKPIDSPYAEFPPHRPQPPRMLWPVLTMVLAVVVVVQFVSHCRMPLIAASARLLQQVGISTFEVKPVQANAPNAISTTDINTKGGMEASGSAKLDKMQIPSPMTTVDEADLSDAKVFSPANMEFRQFRPDCQPAAPRRACGSS